MWAEDWWRRSGSILGGHTQPRLASQLGQPPALGMGKPHDSSPSPSCAGFQVVDKGHGRHISDPKGLAHLLLNKVHDVLEVQIIIVVLDSSSNVIIQKLDGLFR